MANEILTYESNAWLAVAAYSTTSGAGITGKDTQNNQMMTKEQLKEFNTRYRVDHKRGQD